jgi:hypothetical protein
MMMLMILCRCRFLTLHRCGAGHETGSRHTIPCPALHSLDSYALLFQPIVALLTGCSQQNTEPRVLNSPMHNIKSYTRAQHRNPPPEEMARQRASREGASNVIRSVMWKPSIFTFSFPMSHFSARKQVPALLSSSLIVQTDVLGA